MNRVAVDFAYIRPCVSVRLLTFPVLCVAFLLSGCGTSEDGKTQAVAQPLVIELNTRDVIKASQGQLQPSVEISGALYALRTSTAQPLSGGNVLQVFAQEGEAVTRGQPLVTLNTQDANARLAQAEANLAAVKAQAILADSVYQRNAKLYKQGFVSAVEYERSLADKQAQAENLKAQQAMVDIAQKARTDSVVRAPISGIISSRQVEPGQTVAVGQALMQVVDLNTLELEATAPASTQPYLRVGQAVNFHIQGITGQSFEGHVSRINPVINNSTRTLTFYVQVQNGARQLRPGMFAQGTLHYGNVAKGVMIPQKALQQDANGQPIVWAILAQKLTPTVVKVIERDDVSDQVIVDGIAADTQLTTLSLAEGAKGRTVKLTP